MGLKLGQNINFRFFFRFLSVSGLEKAFWSQHWSRHTAWSQHWSRQLAWSRHTLLVATYFPVATYSPGRDIPSCHDIPPGRDILPVATYFLSRHTFLVATYFLTATCFSSPTCRGHNFFILTRSWACEYSLERYLNVEFSHEGI